MRIAAGELDRRIALWRALDTNDGTATVPGEPAKVATRWAKKTDVSDGERVRSAELGQEITTRWLVRSDAVTRTITAEWTIRYRGREYAITGTKESAEREDGIEITSVARPDQDPA